MALSRISPLFPPLLLLISWISFLPDIIHASPSSFSSSSASSGSIAFPTLPVVNISSLLLHQQRWNVKSPLDPLLAKERSQIIRQIGSYCREIGFFYISGHGVDLNLQSEIDLLSKEYFSLSNEEKNLISMRYGGKAWRGSFLVGDEMTSGIPDQKEGLYFGKELSSNETLPLHGPNLWPKGMLGQMMKVSVLNYMDQLTRIGTVLIQAIFEDLGIPSHILASQFSDPTILFRFFHYPPHNESYGPLSQPVGEHTDYGYLTLLRQDANGGLQAKLRKEVNKEIIEEWVDVPPIPNTFVINLGDALQHNTGGLLIATPHRVKQRLNTSTSRYSYPFFFDPSFTSEMVSVEHLLRDDDKKIARANKLLAKSRWDKSDPTLYQGTYGNYLINKVTKVFPKLAVEVGLLPSSSSAAERMGEEL